MLAEAQRAGGMQMLSRSCRRRPPLPRPESPPRPELLTRAAAYAQACAAASAVVSPLQRSPTTLLTTCLVCVAASLMALLLATTTDTAVPARVASEEGQGGAGAISSNRGSEPGGGFARWRHAVPGAALYSMGRGCTRGRASPPGCSARIVGPPTRRGEPT